MAWARVEKFRAFGDASASYSKKVIFSLHRLAHVPPEEKTGRALQAVRIASPWVVKESEGKGKPEVQLDGRFKHAAEETANEIRALAKKNGFSQVVFHSGKGLSHDGSTLYVPESSIAAIVAWRDYSKSGAEEHDLGGKLNFEECFSEFLGRISGRTPTGREEFGNFRHAFAIGVLEGGVDFLLSTPQLSRNEFEALFGRKPKAEMGRLEEDLAEALFLLHSHLSHTG